MIHLTVNLNDPVWVKLTPEGEKAYDAYWGNEPKNDFCMRTHRTINGYLREELWSLIHIFGKYTYMGGKPMFDMVIHLTEPPRG